MQDITRFSIFRGKRILLTGDTGFKGSWLALWLTELDAELTGFALPPESDATLYARLGLQNVYRHVDGDLRNLTDVSRVMDEVRPELVFHLGAQAIVRRSYQDPQATFATNLLGSVNVLESIRRQDSVRALVYITSDKCYENKEWPWGYRESDELGGRDPYSASKACAEIAFRAYSESFFRQRKNFGAASTRAGNVIGGGDRAADRIVPDAVRALERGEPLTLRSPNATRPWQHVLDPLRGYMMLGVNLLENPAAFCGAWNFGPDDTAIRTVDDLAKTFIQNWGAGEVAYHADASAPHEATLLHLSSDKAHRQLQWRPRLPFEEAVAQTARWYRAVHDGIAPMEITRQQIAHFSQMETA